MPEATEPGVQPDSLSRQIYAALREGIIRGRFPQGSRLAEQRLAEAIAELTDNELMRSVSGWMMWLFYMTSELDPLDAVHGHEELLTAIASGNGRVAESVAYTHIERDRWSP